jgi:hypothetical protein
MLMRLSTFIQDTLYEIALGVELARARAIELVAISPSSLDGQAINERSYVDFDVSVVVSEEQASRTGGSGKLGGEIRVAAIFKASAEGGGSKEANSARSTEQTHRVAFKVPIYMGANYKTNQAAIDAAAIFLEKYKAARQG